MAEKTYTLEQAAGKFGKTPEQFKKLAKENGIKELREGSNILYRVEDIDALGQSRASVSDDTVLNIEDSMVGSNDESSLLDMEPLDQKGDDDDDELEIDADMSSMVELTEADTRSGISDSDDEDQADESVISLADSLPDDLTGDDSDFGSGSGSGAKINADEDIESDSAEGSGSGLLDLSLQADDSQFGAVLDDILPGGEGGDADEFADFDDDEVPTSGDEFTAAAAAVNDDDDDLDAEEIEKPEPEQYTAPQTTAAPTAAPAAVAYRTPVEDPGSGIFGVMMLVPFIAAVFAAIVLVSGFRGVTPSLFAPIEEHFLYIVAGLAALTLILGIVGAVSGSGKSEKQAKAKPKKEKKPKKAKKKK